nr:hypothetical protein [Tanacetum cinerariifolium]
MTKVIKEEFKKLGLLEINDDLFTYDTQLGMIFNDSLFTYEIEVLKPTPCIEQRTKQWLDLKYKDHKTMDKNVKNEVYWMRGDDEVVFSNNEVSDLKDENNDDEQEIAEIFRNETNLFDYETPMCTKFNEFNYLLKVDTELSTHDIQRTKTYEDYENKLNDELGKPWSKNRVPYEICDRICEPFCFKNGKPKWPTCNSNEDGFCNGGELPRMANVNTTHDPYLNGRNGRTSYNFDIQDKKKQHEEGRCDLIDDSAQELLVCKIRRFEMIKYSFGQEEEYDAIKKYEYNVLTRTNEDACHAYQEIFRNIDEGWLVKRTE